MDRILFAVVAALALGVASSAAAQGYPNKPIKVVIGFTPGGAPDLLARLVGPMLGERLGQPVIVENRPGAAGNIGAVTVARSAPDGHTLLMATVSLAISPAVYRNAGFDPAKDFAPVTMAASLPLFLVVHPGVPANSVGELVDLARRHPGRLNYASAGVGSPQHLSGELFKMLTGAQIEHVPYKGGPEIIAALLRSESQIYFGPVLSHIKAGRLRALAVTTSKRSPMAPDVPTLVEAGLADYQADNWNAVFAPAGTPGAIIARLNAELKAILALAQIKERVAQLGWEAVSSSPEELGAYLGAEMEKWRRVARAAGASID